MDRELNVGAEVLILRLPMPCPSMQGSLSGLRTFPFFRWMMSGQEFRVGRNKTELLPLFARRMISLSMMSLSGIIILDLNHHFPFYEPL